MKTREQIAEEAFNGIESKFYKLLIKQNPELEKRWPSEFKPSWKLQTESTKEQWFLLAEYIQQSNKEAVIEALKEFLSNEDLWHLNTYHAIVRNKLAELKGAK